MNQLLYHVDRKQLGKKLIFFLPPLITVAVLFVVYAINGIYPFGDGSVVYNDLGQNTLPSYVAVWDVVHGDNSALLSWNTGGGVFVNAVLTGVLNPVNVIFSLFCPRGMILEGMSFMLMLKMALSSLTAYAFFNKKFKIASYWNTVLALLYAFCAYVLEYYTNMEWLDVVLLFPLVILALDALIEKGKVLPYVIVLTLMLFQSLYISYMVFFFLFFVGGLYIFMVIEKENRKKAAFNFGFGSAAAIALSAVVTIPSYMYMASTSRFEERKSLIQIFNTVELMDYSKLGMVFIMTALPIALIILMLINFNKDRRRVGFFLISIAVCALPVIFENINLFWHMGSYMKFPMRFAFILAFVCLTAGAYALEKFSDEFFEFKKKYIPFIIFGAAFGGYGLYNMFISLYENESASKLVTSGNYNILISVTFCLATLYFVILSFTKKRFAYAVTAIIIAAELVVNAGAAVTTGSSRFREYRLDCIDICEDISSKWSLENDGLSRVKVLNSTLNTNYPQVLGYPAMSNFTHVLPANLQDTMDSLGYSTVYTRILDSGGTPFTDALLNIKNTLSSSEVDSDIYEFEQDLGDYSLYSNRFTLPFGITFTSSELFEEELLEGTCFEVNNKIYTALSGDENELFDTPATYHETYNGRQAFDVYVKGERRLYIEYSGGLDSRKSTILMVNGEKFTIPSLDEEDNQKYTTSFNNKIVDLGVYENEQVRVVIIPVNGTVEIDPDTVNIATLDLNRLSSFCSAYNDYDTDAVTGKRSLEMTVTANTDGEYVFLPLTYDDGWSCTVNGEKAEIKTAIGSFMAVKLNSGENSIRLSFLPQKFALGAVISVASAAALAGYLIIRRRVTDFDNKAKTVYAITEKVYGVLWAAAFIVIYVISMLCTFINAVLDT